MRKPFLFLLFVFSFWIWSTDIIDILFYYLKRPYSSTTGIMLSFIPFLITTYLFTKLFLKHYEIETWSIKLNKKQLLEYLYLFLFFMPIFYLNFRRIMFPDLNYDVGAYHLYLQELNRYENLKNFNMVGVGGGGGTYFFTLSYKMFGAFRHLLGFRMATIFNSLLLFVCFVSMYDLIKMIVSRYMNKIKFSAALIILSALFTTWADNILIVLNTYMVDLVGVPILIELLIIVLFKKLTDQNHIITTLFFFLLVSLLVTYKLTYLPYALVMSICFIIQNHPVFLKKKYLIAFGFTTLLFPLLYLIYNYTETHNPIFPFYNNFFKSDLFPLANFKDPRWGPKSISEFFTYNIVCAMDSKRSNEWRFFSVRLLVEYFIILSCLIYLLFNKFRLKDEFIKQIFAVSAIAISLNYMLLLTTGYYRYGAIIELFFGLCIILWLLYFIKIKNYYLFSGLLILSSIQCVNTFNRLYKRGTNLSWYAYKDLRKNRYKFVREQNHLLFHDRNTNIDSLVNNLKIDAFLSSDCDGYAKLLSPHSPVYNTNSYGNRKEIIIAFEKNVIDTFSQKHNLYLLTRKESSQQKIHELNERKYNIDTIVKITPSFTFNESQLFLLKLRRVDTVVTKPLRAEQLQLLTEEY